MTFGVTDGLNLRSGLYGVYLTDIRIPASFGRRCHFHGNPLDSPLNTTIDPDREWAPWRLVGRSRRKLTLMASSFNILEDRKFVVVEVVKADPPPGESGDRWYRYIIDHGSAPISGIRSGSQDSVRRYAEAFAENLNQRKLGFSPNAPRAMQRKNS